MDIHKYENIEVFDLRPDRSLIDPNFQGYKLKLETLPTFNIPFDHDLDVACATEEQYSLQHAKIFSLTNHIFNDVWNSTQIYFVDSNWTIQKYTFDNSKMGTLTKMWTIPANNDKKPGRFNVTINFPDEHHIIIGDGCGMLYVIETGPRDAQSLSEWKVIFQKEVFGTKKNKQFIVLDSTVYTNEAKSQDSIKSIDILMLRIDDRKEWDDFTQIHQSTCLSSSNHPFVTILEWVTISSEGKDCIVTSARSLLGRSNVDYAAIEKDGTAIYIASDDPFHFVFDSENPVKISAPIETSLDQSNIQDQKNSFVWYQNNQLINLWFRLPEDSKTEDATVEINEDNIHIKYKTSSLLTGKLFDRIDPKKSSWLLKSGKLEIILSKMEKIGTKWDTLIAGNASGEQIGDPKLVDEIHSELSQPSTDRWGADPHKIDVYDPQQLEECDENPPQTALLMRIDRKLQKITHKANLDNHKWVFNVRNDGKKVSSICLRHDVDGIVWEPQKLSHESTNLWSCKHVSTFSALGYIQASKEKKKFTISSPDFSYVAICDTSKHIYLYHQPSPLEFDLRNRKMGTKVSHISVQHVISLDPPQLEIMGSFASNSCLYILTMKNLYKISIKQHDEIN